MIIEKYRRGYRFRVPSGRSTKSAKRSTIGKLSRQSRKRLGFVYTQGNWRSMLTLTYHSAVMPSQEESKRHLDNFLRSLRRKGIKYLWVLEWQRRGIPHYHVWMDTRFRDCPESKDNNDSESWRPLMNTWLRVSGQSNDKQAVAFHRHQGQYTDWNIVVGHNYAAKYATKADQKGLPAGVDSYGRWWGCSRGSVVLVEGWAIDERDEASYRASVLLRRDIRKAMEHWQGWKKPKKFRSSQRGGMYELNDGRMEAVERLILFHGEDFDIEEYYNCEE